MKAVIPLALCAAVSISSMAHAQSSGTVIMRKGIPDLTGVQRTLTPIQTEAPGDTTPGVWDFYGDVVVQPGCSSASPATREVRCVAAADHSIVLPDARCLADQKPAGVSTYPNYSTCTYAWGTGTWSVWSSYCSDAATKSRTDPCMRSNGTAYLDYAVARTFCDESKPHDAVETVQMLTSCEYVPTYSTTYSECVGGSQSAAMLKCTRRDKNGQTPDKDVGLASCTPSTLVKSCVAITGCSPLVVNKTLNITTSIYDDPKVFHQSVLAPVSPLAAREDKIVAAEKTCRDAKTPNPEMPYKRYCMVQDHYPTYKTVSSEIIWSSSPTAALPGVKVVDVPSDAAAYGKYRLSTCTY